MSDISFTNLFFVSLIALCAPTLMGLLPRLPVPSVVMALAAGVALGPSRVGLIQVDGAVQMLAMLGLAFLLFLAGLEIDRRRIRGHLLRVALVGYGLTLITGGLAGLLFGVLDWVRSPMLVAVTLSATSLGVIVPVLVDAEQTETRCGLLVIAASSVAEFGSVLLLSLLFSTSGGSLGERSGRLVWFVAVVAAVGVALAAADRSAQLRRLFLRLQDTTAELRVRGAVALLIGFVVLAQQTGLETILGAFMAGLIVAAIDGDSTTHPRFRAKLEGIGYGFLVPVFFITSGLQLDLHEVFASPSAALRVPAFLLALLLVRGMPAVLYLRAIGGRASLAAALLQATSLPVIVTAVRIGVAHNVFLPVNAVALICAGLLSTLMFPPAALWLLHGRSLAQPNTAQQSTVRVGGDPFVMP